MLVLYNRQGQLSQYNVFIFSLNVDREGDHLILGGTRFYNQVNDKILSPGSFSPGFFYYLQFFESVLS